jgi:arylsulfatase A-like enzyme
MTTEAVAAPREASPDATTRDTLAPSLAALGGWLAVAVGNAASAMRKPAGSDGVAGLGVELLFDLGHTLAIGLFAALVTELWVRFGPTRRGARYVALSGLAMTLGVLLLRDDVDGVAARLLGDERDLTVATWVFAALTALALPAALAVGRFLARPRWRLVGIAIAVTLILSNDRVLVNGYPGIHALISGCAATLFAGAASGGRVGPQFGAELSFRRALAPAAVLATLSLLSLIVTPPRAIRARLLQRDTALIARLLPDDAARGEGSAVIPRELRPWFTPRTGRADVPPSPTRLAPQGAIILLVTIDALRTELLEPDHQKDAPNLHELAKTSATFTQARAFGSDTRYSLAALFSGRHYSMLNWTWRSRLRPTLENDRTPRLPELMRPHGIRTVTGVSLPNMLVPRIGIVRGFHEQYIKDDSDKKPGTEEVIDHAIDMLRRQGPGPLFYYTHLIDPHAPYYKRDKEKRSTPYEAYLGEVRFADRHLGRLMEAIDEFELRERTVLIVSSDHGEAFGEHGLYHHNKSLYEVMVHVPLLVQLPERKARTVHAHVSMMDIGPTVLDLLGVDTPGYFMGESLVPLLAGEKPPPHRPILMEKPTEFAFLFPDGVKVMLRTRPASEEIYDLSVDPEEENDLREQLGAEGDRRVALARAYVDAHRTQPDAQGRKDEETQTEVE